MTLGSKQLSLLLAVLVAVPACCCFGEVITGLLVVESETFSCCSSGDENEESAFPTSSGPIHPDCACSFLVVVQAEPVASLSASGFFSTSLFAESAYMARIEIPLRKKIGCLHSGALERGSTPIPILYQTFLV